MNIRLIIITILFSLFSTGVMTYIALATPIGPWIAPTLVLLGTFVVHLCGFRGNEYVKGLALATAGGSVGGIIATALAFSFPTIFYLDRSFFDGLMSEPLVFIAMVAGLSLAGGSLGMLVADLVEQKMIVKDELPFPVGQLTYKLIAAQNQARKAIELIAGIISTLIFTIFQSGFGWAKGVAVNSVTLFNQRTMWPFVIPQIRLELNVLPMLLAIGFIAGHLVAVPLIVGALGRYLIMDPINAAFFSTISNMDFMLAFGSGLVAIGAVQSFIDLPKMLARWYKKKKGGSSSTWFNVEWLSEFQGRQHYIQIVLTVFISIVFLTYLQFNVLTQLYLLVCSFVCAYQIAMIAGKIGLAQLGRFATFVMVPSLFLFNVNPLQIAVIATFIELCGGVATDVLFGRKMAQLAGITRQEVRRYQYLGLIISSISAGTMMWLLISHFGLGVGPLFAQRAAGRALLINVSSFNWTVVLLGSFFGYMLKKLKLNPMLVLGGLLMPINYSLGLIVGGLLSFVVKDRDEWEPFWSGVFAANSIAELLKTVL